MQIFGLRTGEKYWVITFGLSAHASHASKAFAILLQESETEWMKISLYTIEILLWKTHTPITCTIRMCRMLTVKKKTKKKTIKNLIQRCT